MNVSKRQQVAQVGNGRPPKRPVTPYARKMVSPSGDVNVVVLATGRTIDQEPANQYGPHIISSKLKKGWLFYSECPEPDGHKCKGIDPAHPGRFWRRDPETRRYIENECCEHLQAIMDERKAAHALKQSQYNEKFRSQQERIVRAMEKQAEAFADATSPRRGK